MTRPRFQNNSRWPWLIVLLLLAWIGVREGLDWRRGKLPSEGLQPDGQQDSLPPPFADEREPNRTTNSGQSLPDFRDRPAAPDDLEPGLHELERVVDGDTLLLKNGAPIRLLGVDTPETVRPKTPVQPWGREASAFTKEFCAGGKVRLEFDRERKDHYGRFLAYVYVDGQLLNEELLRAGMGRFLGQFPYSSVMKKRFSKAQDEAKAAGRGIWSSRPSAPATMRKAG